MSSHQIVCQNCGAKYKIPASFTGTKAKCNKPNEGCGAVIDVAAQIAAQAEPADAGTPSAARPAAARPAAALPAAGRPAAARPAAARPARPDRGEEATGRPSRGGKGGGKGDEPASGGSGGSRRSSSRRAGSRKGDAEAGTDAGGDGDKGGSGRRRGEREPKKANNMPLLIGGGVVGLGVVIVVAVMIFGGGGDPGTTGQTGPNGVADNSVGHQDTGGGETTRPDPAGATGAGTAPDQTADPSQVTTETTIPAPVAKPDGAAPAKPVPVDDFDPASLAPVAWPSDVTTEERETAVNQVAALPDGGRPAIRAKAELAIGGLPALLAVVDRLRTFNYADVDQAMDAYELNQLIEQVIGRNLGFRAPQPPDPQPPEDVIFNKKTARVWHQLASGFADKAAFAAYVAKNKEKGKASEERDG